MINIRFAKISDIENIRNFLRQHWSENNILVKSRKIFDYQYCSRDVCHFVIAINDLTNEIYGVKGYFPFNSLEKPDIAAALAIVLQGVRPMLGMEIQRFLERETNSRWLCATGLNPNTSVKIYKLFKSQYTVDKLRQYYRLADKDAYNIARVYAKMIPTVDRNNAVLKSIKTMTELEKVFDIESQKHHKPYKDRTYLEYRYFNHPVYHYQVFGIILPGEDKASGIIFSRKIECNCSRVLRIVDYIGKTEALSEIGFAIQKLINDNEYEYIDFYCYGIPHEFLVKAGFVCRDDSDPNIIPNYFEPFVQENKDIYFFYTGTENYPTVFKADGDQDRPSILPEGWIE